MASAMMADERDVQKTLLKCSHVCCATYCGIEKCWMWVMRNSCLNIWAP